MARATTKWPEGLDDLAAMERLQSIMLSACDGARDLARDRAYKAFRKRLLQRDDLIDFVPSLVTTHNDLDSFVSAIKEIADREERRERVRNSFQAILSTLRPSEAPSTESSSWTGRLSPSQQARIVRALAAPALEVVDRLIAEQERALDNGGPIDADQAQALQDLRDLHAALGELIRLVDAARPIEGVLGRLAEIKDRAIRGLTQNLGADAAALPGTISTVMVGLTTIGITQLLTGNEVAAAAMGGMAASAFPKLRPAPAAEPKGGPRR
jgi:hypothetical protein